MIAQGQLVGPVQMPTDNTHHQKHSRTRIKFCGFTRKEDIDTALSLGADALGFVFYPKSKRYLTPAQAGQLTRHLPPFVSTLALFVDPEPAFVKEVISAMHPSLLQFHGDEDAQFCDSFDWPYLKAFRVGAPGMDSPDSLQASCLRFSNASGWLFDSYTPAYGGSGHSFDRSLLSHVMANPSSRPVILSGGLTPENVQAQVEALRPWAVDVSSGIEEAPGIKSARKMALFAQAVRLADNKV